MKYISISLFCWIKMLDKCIGTIVCIMSRQLCKPHHYLTRNWLDLIQTDVPTQYANNVYASFPQYKICTKNIKQVNNIKVKSNINVFTYLQVL